MTVIIYQCAHCGKLYEEPRFSCLWCASPIKRLELTGDEHQIFELTTADLKTARRNNRKEIEELKDRGIAV